MTLLFALLILSLAAGGGPLAYLLSRPLVVALGKAGYAIYILQIPVSFVLRVPPPLHSLVTLTWHSGALVAAGCLCSWFVERPMRQAIRAWLASPRTS